MGVVFIPLRALRTTAWAAFLLIAGLVHAAPPEGCAGTAAEPLAAHAQADCLLAQARKAFRERRYADVLSAVGTIEALPGSIEADVAFAAGLEKARALYQLGRVAEMERETASLRERSASRLGLDHPRTLEAQNLNAVALRNLGRTAEAIVVYEDLVARRMRIDGANAVETLRAKNNHASALRDAGEYARARALFREIHEARSASLGSLDEQTVAAWHNFASVDWESGGSQESAQAVEAALPGQQRALGPENPEILRLKTLLGAMLEDQGRFEEAMRLFAEVLEIRRRKFGGTERFTQQAARNLASSALRAGLAQDALRILERAREDLRDSDRSDPALREILRLQALIRFQAGDAAGGLALLESQLGAGGRDAGALGALSLPELNDELMRAQALFMLGRPADSLAIQRRILGLLEARLGPRHPRTLEALRSLAYFLFESGDAGGARERFEEFVARTEERDGALAGTSELHRRQLSQGIQSLFQSAGYKTYVRLLAGLDPPRGLEVAELAKARSLAQVHDDTKAGADREAIRESAWRLAKAEETLASSDPGTPRYLEAAAERTQAESRLRALRPRRPAARAGANAQVASLPRGVAFVSYVVDGDAVAVLVAGRDGNISGRDLGRLPHLAGTVEAYRRLLASPDPASERAWRLKDGYRWSLARPEPEAVRVQDAAEIARYLSRRLVEPIAAWLAGSPRWAVSPDGPLAFLPFDLLEIGGKSVGAQHELTLVPSLAAVTVGKARAARVLPPGPPREFLGIGISAHAAGRPDLPQAQEEVRHIANLFAPDRRTILLGPQATEAAFARLDASGELERYRYIHVATHAFLSRRGSSLSGVVLAPDPADPANDGIVTAAEWPAYRLRSDLVVLSACDTGLGTVLPGEGVMGLPYSLLLAGTRDVLLTLWPVADAAAADFMPRFYRRLRQGLAPSRALAQTKRELRAGGGPHAHARHWAAFVLYGVP